VRSASVIQLLVNYCECVKRGRPAYPDLLTPREWEVLALIREGLTNEQIAARLGVSERGARYHVSEILSKLGLKSRDEAAAWTQEPTPKWSMLSPISIFHGVQERALSLLTPKVVAVLVGSIALTGVALATLSDRGSLGLANLASSSAKPSSTPDPLEWCRPHCDPLAPRRFTTLEEAASVASFEPKLPLSLPPGFEPYLVEHTRLPTNPPGRKEVHNDWITVYYRNSAGGVLIISQGFPAMPAIVAFPGPGLNQKAPQNSKGTVQLGDEVAYWLRGDAWSRRDSDLKSKVDAGTVPIPALEAGGFLVAWEVGRFGSGWAISPDRSGVEFGSPMSYGIMSDVLSLGELVRIAESVSFD
jgi:DNA-binding CsgD family transcriptional regulator